MTDTNVQKRLLLVEDDKSIAMGLEYSLTQEGYAVEIRETVADSIAWLKSAECDFAVLDLSLPDGSGYEICRYIKAHTDIPVIFLTACDDEVNVVMGLDMGADDYITKPFRIRELLSRIQSVSRRYNRQEAQPVAQYGDVRVNLKQARVFKGDREVLLTALEYRLLLTLIQHEGQVLSRRQLLAGIWDEAGDFVNDNTLTVYIKRLREKLEDNRENPQIIRTVRGLGYKVGD